VAPPGRGRVRAAPVAPVGQARLHVTPVVPPRRNHRAGHGRPGGSTTTRGEGDAELAHVDGEDFTERQYVVIPYRKIQAVRLGRQIKDGGSRAAHAPSARRHSVKPNQSV